MAEVLSAREVADALGVSAQRVRQLIRDGRLRAHRSSAGWLVPQSAVRERLDNVERGRPVESGTVWAAVALLVGAASTGSRERGGQPAQIVADRRLRHRVLRMLAGLPDPVDDPGPWARLLSHRGSARRMWAHPGVLEALAADGRVSPGGDLAASIEGLVGGSRRHQLYVRAPDVDKLVHQYRLRDNDDGNVVLIVVPDSVPAGLAPLPGRPAPEPAVAADLLDEDDPRARHAALQRLRGFHQAVYQQGLARSQR